MFEPAKIRNNYSSAPNSTILAATTVRRVLTVWFWTCSVYYLWTSLLAVLDYSWPQPSFDQYRVYLSLLQVPFPQNILLPDNGHHSIFPFLVILAENQWFSANQMLQSTVATLCALITAAVPTICVLREPNLTPLQRAAGVLLSILGVFWLANAISLLHGNEGLSVYMVSASMAVAAWCTFESKRRGSSQWLVAAALACCVATFSFGSGIASFPAVLLLGFLLRISWPRLLIPVAGLALCLALYLFVLPGDDGIRKMLNIHPLHSLKFAAQWLSAPWIAGWLGLADPPASFFSVNRDAWYGALVVRSANLFVGLTHLSWRTWGIVMGGIGAFGFGIFLIRTFFSGREICRTEAVAMGIVFFVATTAAVIGVGRLDYLLANPDQAFADRYLIWSSLFWASVGLLVLLRAHRKAALLATTLFLTMLPVMLYATHMNGLGWSAAVCRGLQATAAGLRSDVFDEAAFPSDESTGRQNEWRSVDLLKEKRLAMYARPGWERLGTQGPSTLDGDVSISADAHWEDSFIDPRNGLRAARFSGLLSKKTRNLSGRWQVAAIDESGKIVGFGEHSFAGYGDKWLNLSVHRKRGFDGYIKNYDPARKYILMLWNSKTDRALRLAELPPGAPVRAPAPQ